MLTLSRFYLDFFRNSFYPGFSQILSGCNEEKIEIKSGWKNMDGSIGNNLYHFVWRSQTQLAEINMKKGGIFKFLDQCDPPAVLLCRTYSVLSFLCSSLEKSTDELESWQFIKLFTWPMNLKCPPWICDWPTKGQTKS